MIMSTDQLIPISDSNNALKTLPQQNLDGTNLPDPPSQQAIELQENKHPNNNNDDDNDDTVIGKDLNEEEMDKETDAASYTNQHDDTPLIRRPLNTSTEELIINHSTNNDDPISKTNNDNETNENNLQSIHSDVNSNILEIDELPNELTLPTLDDDLEQKTDDKTNTDIPSDQELNISTDIMHKEESSTIPTDSAELTSNELSTNVPDNLPSERPTQQQSEILNKLPSEISNKLPSEISTLSNTNLQNIKNSNDNSSDPEKFEIQTSLEQEKQTNSNKTTNNLSESINETIEIISNDSTTTDSGISYKGGSELTHKDSGDSQEKIDLQKLEQNSPKTIIELPKDLDAFPENIDEISSKIENLSEELGEEIEENMDTIPKELKISINEISKQQGSKKDTSIKEDPPFRLTSTDDSKHILNDSTKLKNNYQDSNSSNNEKNSSDDDTNKSSGIANEDSDTDDEKDAIDAEVFSKLLDFEAEIDPDELFSPNELLPPTLSTTIIDMDTSAKSPTNDSSSNISDKDSKKNDIPELPTLEDEEELFDNLPLLSNNSSNKSNDISQRSSSNFNEKLTEPNKDLPNDEPSILSLKNEEDHDSKNEEHQKQLDQHTPAFIIHEKNNLLYPSRKNSLTPVTLYGKYDSPSSRFQNKILKPNTISNIQTDKSGVKNNDQPVNNANSQSTLPTNPDNNQLNPKDLTNLLYNGAQRLSDESKISAYARLDFQSFTFYVQTLHVILGRRSENDFSHKVDVNLGPSKSISRRHAQIFYNFGTGRYELSVLGRNGVFINEQFVEKGHTVPLKHKTKIQIGEIPFQFVLPEQERDPEDEEDIKSSPAIPDMNALEIDDEDKHLIGNGHDDSNTSLPDLNDNEFMPLDDDMDLDDKPLIQIKQSKISSSSISTTSTSKPQTLMKTTSVKTSPAKKKKIQIKKEPPKEKKPAREPKKVYSINEIPPEYRNKPLISYSVLLTTCIRKYATPKGMSLSEIYNAIRETYPYYKYCRDGWQSSVRHNLSLNKSFRKVSKGGKGWLWGLDEDYITERDRQKKVQAETAANKAKASQMKVKQQQKKVKKSVNLNPIKQPITPSYNANNKRQTISQTLAANRAATNNNKANKANDQRRTMKYLQEQLIILTRDRKGLQKATITDILTQALAMTINQVTKAAKSKGISGNPLTALMDKNPQHLNLILAAAVNAATVKVTKGKVKSLVDLSTVTLPTVVPGANSDTSSTRPTLTQTITRKNPSDNSFDPTSLSRFFQPRQNSSNTNNSTPKITVQSMSKNSLPQKRTRDDSDNEEGDDDEEEDSSSDSSSNDSDSGSNSDSDIDSGSDNDTGSSEDSDDGSGSDNESINSSGSDSGDSSDEESGSSSGTDNDSDDSDAGSDRDSDDESRQHNEYSSSKDKIQGDAHIVVDDANNNDITNTKSDELLNDRSGSEEKETHSTGFSLSPPAFKSTEHKHSNSENDSEERTLQSADNKHDSELEEKKELEVSYNDSLNKSHSQSPPIDHTDIDAISSLDNELQNSEALHELQSANPDIASGDIELSPLDGTLEHASQ
ncbi:hypothetical protein TBLA_0C02390 [Henningerozyma blattae CBS 6284]|uniref:Pre-rRNA-processing protein FHL1 n=1 Tax=Henningerozyma blattae (strain ATCC 34711 / CBS 6284 / DSM 70876 / NBRC 10599 / NRRL Y-10934 / UCD 77-7) TaxID=1071380 RepID=I2H0Z7_HENB6|nr:hypothetical protein TBLA_0C02390 [Tetrapisispora blattae CBS 6284]CCH60049.1 hypothetical protein TBLA_0C02390 [Tetrapisispora blattae CBS 6284]